MSTIGKFIGLELINGSLSIRGIVNGISCYSNPDELKLIGK